jgi:hypothetical protein
MALKATEVFTPGSFPKRTYVERAGEGLEGKVRDALATEGQIVSLVGPSKAGKTVLVERVVGRDLLIPITGAGIKSPDDVWTRVLDWINAPSSTMTATKFSGSLGPIGGERESTREVTRGGLTQVVREIANSDFVLLVDDFQYMPRDVQVEVARTLKEAARSGIKICTATVVHRGDDLVRSNPELRGRVTAVDLGYWRQDDLAQIASLGFDALNISFAHDSVAQLTKEAAGSPQLMQLLCLTACFVLGMRSKQSKPHDVDPTQDTLSTIFSQASATADFRSLVDVLHAGPRTRGTERKIYRFKDGTEGDVYRCVLRAIASDPPRLSFAYDDLTERAADVCAGDVPAGSSVTGTCVHMSKLAIERFPDERAIEWDDQKQILDLPDPYLLFYLRWSDRLSEPDE